MAKRAGDEVTRQQTNAIRRIHEADAQRAAWERSLARLEAAGLGWTKGATKLREKLEGK